MHQIKKSEVSEGSYGQHNHYRLGQLLDLSISDKIFKYSTVERFLLGKTVQNGHFYRYRKIQMSTITNKAE